MSILSGRMPTIKQLQCFVAVAQELNFRRAADRMNMSQPPLSRQIHSLEQLLRIKLIERDTHNVSLTSAGERFEREAHTILATLGAAMEALRRDCRAEEADVRLGLTSVIDFSFVEGIRDVICDPEFSTEVRIERAYSKHLLERLKTGEIDLALVGDIPVQREGLEIRLIAKDPLMVALPDYHEASRLEKVSFDDLEGTVLFWFPRNDNPVFYDNCAAVFSDFRYDPPRRPEPDDHVALLSRIAGGEGIAFFPASMRAASRVGVTYRRFIPEIEARMDIELLLAWRPSETRAEVLRTAELLQNVATKG
nr:LysR family transcriptional regulator [uncultured Halomonas sp.]